MKLEMDFTIEEISHLYEHVCAFEGSNKSPLLSKFKGALAMQIVEVGKGQVKDAEVQPLLDLAMPGYGVVESKQIAPKKIVEGAKLTWSDTKPAERQIRRAENEQSEDFVKVRNFLANTGLAWKTESQWGTQIFDFWCVQKGLAIYVNPTPLMLGRGKKTNAKNRIEVISVTDTSAYGLSQLAAKILRTGTWNSRRRPAGLKPMASGGECK